MISAQRLSLDEPQGNDGLAYRTHRLAVGLGSVHQLQQTHHHVRCRLEHAFQLGHIGIFHHQAQKAQQQRTMRVRTVMAHHGRPGKEIALEQPDTQLLARFVLFEGIHFFGQQLAAKALQLLQ